MNRNRNLSKLQELRNGLLSSLNNVRLIRAECIAAPILDGLVEASTSFGRQGKGSDFAQLSHKYSSIQNSPTKKLRFWSYRRIKKEDDDLVHFRMDRKTIENAEHEEEISRRQYEIPLVTPGPTTERTLLVVTLKLKRLSINKPKGIIEQEERGKKYEQIKKVLRMLKGPQTEKEIIVDHVKNDILSRIIECAVFRAKIHQYHRQKNEQTPPDDKNNNDAWEEPSQVSEETIPLVDDQSDAKNPETPPDDENNNDETEGQPPQVSEGDEKEPPQVSEETIPLDDDQSDAKNPETPPDDETEEQPPQVSEGDENDAKTPVQISFDPFEQISRIVMSISDNAFYRVKVHVYIFYNLKKKKKKNFLS